MQNIIDRLGMQSEALQESFKILSRAANLEELAKKYFHILRGNLLVVKASIYFRRRESDKWQELFSKIKNNPIENNAFFRDDDVFSIKFFEHPDIKVSIHHPLIDKGAFRILLGEKLDKSNYNEFDKITLQLFQHQLDCAYQFFVSLKTEKQLLFDLNHRVLQLNSLIDTGIETARLQEGKKLLSLALERVLALTNASKGMLRIKSGTKVIEKIFYPFTFKTKQIEKDNLKISTEFQFADKKYGFYLFEKESRSGFVAFDAIDQLLLDAFARQVHVSLENHYLYEQSLEKERIDSEISVAGAIQSNLIPEKLPEIEGWDQCGINIPTKFIGGDYYDCIPLKDGRYMFIMADVSGKGVAAGLLVSTLHASAHAYLDGPFELEILVQKLNKVIYDAATIDKYITAVFAVLDPEKSELITVSAGHNPTYLLRQNSVVEELSTGGIPLGMMSIPFPYESSISRINPGDSVLFYTDGVTEAMNENEQEYDDIKPLKKFLISHKSENAAIFIENLMTDLHNFTGNTPQSDDITALYLIRRDS